MAAGAPATERRRFGSVGHWQFAILTVSLGGYRPLGTLNSCTCGDGSPTGAPRRYRPPPRGRFCSVDGALWNEEGEVDVAPGERGPAARAVGGAARVVVVLVPKYLCRPVTRAAVQSAGAR
jgi:hypothetical protein